MEMMIANKSSNKLRDLNIHLLYGTDGVGRC